MTGSGKLRDTSVLMLCGSAAEPQPKSRRIHRREPSAAEPQPKLGISRAKTPRPQSSEKRTGWFVKLSIFRFRTWRTLRPFDFTQDMLGGSQSPCSSIPDHRKICAARANFEILQYTLFPRLRWGKEVRLSANSRNQRRTEINHEVPARIFVGCAVRTIERTVRTAHPTHAA